MRITHKIREKAKADKQIITGFARSMENLEKYGIDLSVFQGHEKYGIRGCSIEKYGISGDFFHFSSYAKLLCVSILKRNSC